MSYFEHFVKGLSSEDKKAAKKAEADIVMIRKYQEREQMKFRKKEQEFKLRLHKYDHRWTKATMKLEELRQKATRGETVAKKVGIL